MTLDTLARTILRYRLHFGTEALLQADLEQLLRVEGIPYTREHALTPADRPDFYLPDDRIAIECKINGGLASVGEQILRYAASEDVAAVLLVTRKAGHKFAVQTMGGKPFRTVWIGASGL